MNRRPDEASDEVEAQPDSRAGGDNDPITGKGYCAHHGCSDRGQSPLEGSCSCKGSTRERSRVFMPWTNSATSSEQGNSEMDHSCTSADSVGGSKEGGRRKRSF